MGDVVNLGSRWRKRTTQYFFETRTINPWPQPIDAHVFRGGEMIFPRIFHRKSFRERATKTRDQPITIIVDDWLRLLALLDEIRDHFYDNVFGKTVEIQLHRMLRPVAVPIVVQTNG